MGIETSYPATAAFWFLIVMVPTWIFVAYDDMANLKIRNKVVLLLLAIFVVAGPFLMPFQTYAWQLVQGVVVLAITFGLYGLRAMGGGDAKFIAVAALYMHRADYGLIIMLFGLTFLVAWIAHRILKATIGPKLFPTWDSWTSGKRFPLGLPMGGWVVSYLALSV